MPEGFLFVGARRMESVIKYIRTRHNLLALQGYSAICNLRDSVYT